MTSFADPDHESPVIKTEEKECSKNKHMRDVIEQVQIPSTALKNCENANVADI